MIEARGFRLARYLGTDEPLVRLLPTRAMPMDGQMTARTMRSSEGAGEGVAGWERDGFCTG